jgi:hypothetical protein
MKPRPVDGSIGMDSALRRMMLASAADAGPQVVDDRVAPVRDRLHLDEMVRSHLADVTDPRAAHLPGDRLVATQPRSVEAQQRSHQLREGAGRQRGATLASYSRYRLVTSPGAGHDRDQL